MSNQSLNVFDQKIATEDVVLDKTVAELRESNLITREAQFSSRRELGEFLIEQQGRSKAGKFPLTMTQAIVFDQALQNILGRRLFS